eukprot:Gregarina_sp_Pseudo_9__3009@NODE_3217_length_713_cov_13_354599_g2933_i0_p1_GENE_NODE_3217_length_713_cov_13_354599_g2933_i0NODE_3217_length_713_cov_13_354599_g2933_i0_p1_ORF_typecomplete_len120_score3_21Herpes_gE/PF02480_16/0_00052Reticulon/PF02453_17/0_0048PRIMA1/PF16101_5/0_015TMEM100/PF16311_5/0_016G0G1_switch_2/PF15103_6/0_022TMEM51/PF15345_6/0_03CYYR1/PF10873_8/0_034BORCS6/PF10157_9/0_041CcmD/PF04995_14/0_061CD34_antigen/PF06365_12/0_12TMEM154/PF15102_6/0_12RTA1/PF04479_13/0_11DUF4381/PF143
MALTKQVRSIIDDGGGYNAPVYSSKTGTSKGGVVLGVVTSVIALVALVCAALIASWRSRKKQVRREKSKLSAMSCTSESESESAADKTCDTLDHGVKEAYAVRMSVDPKSLIAERDAVP